MLVYKTPPNPFLTILGGPSGSSAMDLMPSPLTAIPAAVIRGPASPTMQAAVEYMSHSYPRLMKLIKNVYALPSSKMAKRIEEELYQDPDAGKALAWFDPDVRHVWAQEPAAYTSLFSGRERTAIEEAINTLAHEATHAWQSRRNPLFSRIYNRDPAKYEAQAERWGSLAARRFRQRVQKAGGKVR